MRSHAKARRRKEDMEKAFIEQELTEETEKLLEAKR
jgi:hypothetical protein